MARRSRAPKPSRAQGVSSTPTPIHSTNATPCSSAFPSAYPSEDEQDIKNYVKYIPIRRLTLQDFSPGKPKKPEVAEPSVQKSFRFLDLPSELRLKVYELHFADVEGVVDLDHNNYKRVHRKLAILKTCRTIYNEASYFFYSHCTFRIFPTHPGRFFKTKRPLLSRLKPHQRASMTHLELRLGPGWSKPPRGWVVNEALGLQDCVNVQKVTVFVQIDPSASFLDGFRKADGFYEAFSCDLLSNILAKMPHLKYIEFDAWESVGKHCPIMKNLLGVVMENRRKISWGPERGWTDYDEADEGTKTMPASILLDGAGPAILTMA